VAATVTAIRAGDKAAANRPTSGHEGPERPSPMATMALLREAADAAGTVWIGYVDDAGVTVERIVDPLRVEGGRLTAFDHRAATVRSFAIHRVTAVGPVSREPDAAGATP
jgi:predicted DNA-binding transcriptional regulator YafY